MTASTTTPIDARYPTSPHDVAMSYGLAVAIGTGGHLPAGYRGGEIIVRRDTTVIVLLSWYADDMEAARRWPMEPEIVEVAPYCLIVDNARPFDSPAHEDWTPDSQHELDAHRLLTSALTSGAELVAAMGPPVHVDPPLDSDCADHICHCRHDCTAPSDHVTEQRARLGRTTDELPQHGDWAEAHAEPFDFERAERLAGWDPNP